MAVGTQEAQVLGSIIEPITVDVVDLQRQRHFARIKSAASHT
jgi:hypothetical protein